MTDTIEAGVGPKKNLRTWIFNPFYYLAGGQALALGLAFIVAAGLMGSTVNAHLDGVLDAHVGLKAPMWLFPLEGLVDWLSMGLVLWVTGLILSRKRFRPLDLFGTQALARVPAVFLMLVAFVPGIHAQAMKLVTGDFAIVPAEMAAFVVGGFVAIFALVWMVILMYRAFAMSCNVSGGKAIAVFIVALILAEIVCKTAIFGLLFLAIPGFRV